MDFSDFVIINDIIPEIVTELRYYSSFNFAGVHIDGYEEPVALMTKDGCYVSEEARAIDEEVFFYVPDKMIDAEENILIQYVLFLEKHSMRSYHILRKTAKRMVNYVKWKKGSNQ